MSTVRVAPDAQLSEMSIANLISAYAFRNDDADFTALGDLFSDAVFVLDDTVARGRDEIETMARAIIEVGTDGRSTTTHEITNVMIDVNDKAGTAEARSYWTVYRTVLGSPRVPVLSGRYLDRFTHMEQGWRFAERHATTLWNANG
jgi:ketosteroid isomerase-like protein